ncbi:hypothetical protein [Krasilnikovia sp. MM14-A1004]|uniref:hypothetical protein n=1 Tax=Krasilnikovia sp. MM14-A1004 TaxID=3373541 RepID=UPI00399D0B44
MRYALAVVILLAALGTAAVLTGGGPAGGPAPVRIVRAPATAGTATSAAPSADPGRGDMVGFTLVGGRLYLVTARTPAAAAAVRQGDEPAFACAADGPADAPYEAWPLHNAGGGGSLPDLSRDGELLTAPRGGPALSCSLHADDHQ